MTEVHQPDFSRPDSPSPSLSATIASSSEPNVDRSASTAYSYNSSCTSLSLEDHINGEQHTKRRGYTRPQATNFADSARNRDSVMSLGTIAHLQHYFARTGLLDGKGAQLAKESKDGTGSLKLLKPNRQQSDIHRSVSNSYGPDAYATSHFGSSDSPSPRPSSPATSSYNVDGLDEPKLLNLPPTVSTYKQKTHYVPPPPNPSVLRRELREALEDAKKVLVEAREEGKTPEGSPRPDMSPASEPRPTQGWHEIEGLRILDLVTLAIKAAKNYYTSHEQPSRLYALRPERRIRSDLYEVLEVLKKVAARNFTGGFRTREIDDILRWISGIDNLITDDEKAAKAEQEKRESWMWLNGSCNGHEREREWVFLKSFEPKGVNLPPWGEPSHDQAVPGAFLLALRDGVKLVQLHNELVKNSWRQFGEIKKWHTDTAKPYRCMENLRYWLKAAELRWDISLVVDVNAVVQGNSFAAWKAFDAAVLTWSKTVREELTHEYKEQNRDMVKSEPEQLEKSSDCGSLSAPPSPMEPTTPSASH